ncbi:AAA-domain-containing protein [Saitoella complicata NRRL Y-17804]|uniref:AAA+ ATPase domain-containing protein n=1 Tax=Saitoella complicata (strain BCRC 22490 / CBS 7301 / JCM 7358 / NBRC 10748 / NRRL Y-17804) TaxID=698492 RepID=A0A0E9NBI0_SAICN|nr:AAA-domain-containing protein [Saitoella complicata NRRL Y-17804]ODQ55330.1 AAA-domain-containing protein [Saitoella complicata NRRL Y-17804]GAO47163.1 hypothetical protein G7K_1374-t1 [Saitoella complicata NRRL Y-17804]
MPTQNLSDAYIQQQAAAMHLDSPPPPVSPLARPILHVECALHPHSTCRFDTALRHVHTFLTDNFATLTLDTELRAQDGDFEEGGFVREHVEKIRVVEVTGLGEGDGEDGGTEIVGLEGVELDIHVYQLNDDTTTSSSTQSTSDPFGLSDDNDDGDEDECASATVVELPSRSLEGLWDSLVYEGDVKGKLLRFVSTLMLFSDCGVDFNVCSWNRLVLLHGPPGTGKTSLCRALAQKLSIRLSKRFSHGKLIEINSHSLFSKYFSESGKLVGKLFSQITSMVEDEDSFVCVLIDEVESLTSARKAGLGNNEPSDALRVVNALLTQLDRLRRRRNVLVLTTSNLLEAMDPAFVDRADIKQYVGAPSTNAIYTILRSCVNEMIRVGIVSSPTPIPSYAEASIGLYSQPNAPASVLYNVASECQGIGMSGRALRRLPVLAHARYLQGMGSRVEHCLEALGRVVREEREVMASIEAASGSK